LRTYTRKRLEILSKTPTLPPTMRQEGRAKWHLLVNKEDLKSSTPRVCESSQLSEWRANIGTMNVGGEAVGFQKRKFPI